MSQKKIYPNMYILTTEDPLYSDLIIRKMIEEFGSSIKGVGFTGGLITLRRVLLSPFIYGLCRYIKLGVQVVLSSRAGGGKIEKLCCASGLQVNHLSSVKDGQLYNILKNNNIELLVSINCSLKLAKREIDMPRLGVINIHNSALPKYRGLMPILHAIRVGDEENGVTIHYINEKIDDGDIIEQKFVPILSGDDIFTVWKRCVELGSKLLPEVIKKITLGDVNVKRNDASRASYFSFPTFKQICEYRWAVIKLKKKGTELNT